MAGPKLNFVIAGAQKGGTTTLDAIFRCHPQIQMARTKEIHFFDDESRNWQTPDYSGLDRFFPEIDDRLRGEATPITLYWRPAIRRLHAYNPDIKIILLLRNPVERTFSNWRKEYAAGREALPFGEAIRAGRDRFKTAGEVEDLHRFFSYVERSMYRRQIEYLLEHFPRKNIHCEISEDFFRDQRAVLPRLSHFLGINDWPDGILPVHANLGREIDYPRASAKDIAFLSELFREDIAAVEQFIGRAIPIWRAAKSFG